MCPEIDFAGRQIRGERKDQEDFYAFELVAPDKLLLALADGVGGQAAGELASRIAVTGFMDHFVAEPQGTEPARMAEALMQANRRLAEAIDEGPAERTNMATTLLAVLVESLSLYWISVGDSPLLLFRKGNLLRLNVDHSGNDPDTGEKLGRHVLRSALVGGRISLIDWRREPYPLEEGDILLMASDGIWTLSQEEMIQYFIRHSSENADKIAAGLLHLVLDKAKTRQDNVTVALIKAGAKSSG